jgi:hypothetical protein
VARRLHSGDKPGKVLKWYVGHRAREIRNPKFCGILSLTTPRKSPQPQKALIVQWYSVSLPALKMKLDPKAIRYLTSEDFRVLSAVWLHLPRIVLAVSHLTKEPARSSKEAGTMKSSQLL